MMEEQYKKLLEQLSEIRKERLITSIRPSGSSSIGMNMDFSSLYPSTMRFHFGTLKSIRIIKIKKILNKIT